MNRIALLTLGIAAALITANAAEVPKFSRIKIDPVMAKAPIMELRSNSNIIPRGPYVGNWLVIKIEYYPEVHHSSKSIDGGKRVIKRPTSTSHFWLDDVELNVRLIFDSGYKKNSGKSFAGMFSGRTKFWTIKFDSAKHVTQMFIPPQLLERCFPTGSKGNPQFSLRNNIKIETTFTKDGAIIGIAWYNVDGKGELAKAKHFNNYIKNIPQQLNLNNAILPRHQTPWSNYFPDSYDLEKQVQ